MSGSDDLDALLAEAERAIASAGSAQALTEMRARFLGRKGSLSELLRGSASSRPQSAAAPGQAANDAKRRIEGVWPARGAKRSSAAPPTRALAERRIDVTLPGAAPPAGHLHPITQLTREMVEFFASMGFSVETGPEVETDWNNFEALNIPPDHPARDEQDTFYLESGHVLRTHTSNVQIRAMTGRTPPFRFIAPGRVYRHDLSPRHYPMFNQIEGFLVDERVTFGDLKGVLLAFGRHLFGEQTRAALSRQPLPVHRAVRRARLLVPLCGGAGLQGVLAAAAGSSGAAAE